MGLDGAVVAAVSPHPAVRRIELVGSRAEGRATRWSDWDFGVHTNDFAAAAEALPQLLAPLEPLVQQWDRLSSEQCWMLILPGPVKVDLIFPEEPHAREEPWRVAADTLAGIDDHFWDWMLWLRGKEAAGKSDLWRPSSTSSSAISSTRSAPGASPRRLRTRSRSTDPRAIVPSADSAPSSAEGSSSRSHQLSQTFAKRARLARRMARTGQADEAGRLHARVDVLGAGDARVSTGVPVLDHLPRPAREYASFDLELEVAPGAATGGDRGRRPRARAGAADALRRRRRAAATARRSCLPTRRSPTSRSRPRAGRSSSRTSTSRDARVGGLGDAISSRASCASSPRAPG